MTRYFIAGVLALAASPAFAQDMPLSQLLIDGEGWKKVEGTPKERRWNGVVGKWSEEKDALVAGLITGARKGIIVKLGSQGMYAIRLPDAIEEPAGIALSPDSGTLFIGDAAGRYIWAFPVGGPNGLRSGAPYCPVRLPHDKKTSQISGLTTDKDGRIYAATPLGVQVFDPTGRLCGVMAAPPGKAEAMTFEGDKLTFWIGDTKYARKLNTTGVK